MIYFKYLCIMADILKNKDYLLVDVENAKLNIEGILSKLLDGSYLKYQIFKDRPTIFIKGFSLLESNLNDLIQYGENEGVWYSNTWSYMKSFGKYMGEFNTLFYDEFVFLLSEDLIQFDNVDLLTTDDIWDNFDRYLESEQCPYISPLLDCNNLNDLKKQYRKLVMEYHPDRTGSDNIQIRKITETYLKMSKKLI